jgi:sulfide:quinone oxidoreductase
MTSRTHVVIAGGGVAALETCLALHALAGDRVLITLIAPNTYFAYRPTGSHDPLGVRGHVRVPLAYAARAAGADLRHDRVTDVDPVARLVHTASGYELSYDALVLAVGAAPLPVPAGAVPLAPWRATDCCSVVHAVERGDLDSLAFVVPSAPTQELELYDLAIETAIVARRHGASPALTLVTAAGAPLELAGALVAERLGLALASHGVRLVGSAHLRAVVDGELDLAPSSRQVFAERVIAAPRLRGPRPNHLPCDADGFLPTDRFGRVPGVDGVFAAGDCTAFPVKHPSIGAQQADAVAATIAGEPDPFTPVLRCTLPSRLRWYVEAPLTGGQGDATCLSTHPLWPGDARFGATHLTPWLAELQNQETEDGGGDAGDHDCVDSRHDVAAAVASH